MYAALPYERKTGNCADVLQVSNNSASIESPTKNSDLLVVRVLLRVIVLQDTITLHKLFEQEKEPNECSPSDEENLVEIGFLPEPRALRTLSPSSTTPKPASEQQDYLGGRKRIFWRGCTSCCGGIVTKLEMRAGAGSIKSRQHKYPELSTMSD